jgi:hypothetical protein
VVLLGLLLARFFAEPVLSPLWELAGLVVVVVVDETIMVLVSGGWLLRSHEGWAAFFPGRASCGRSVFLGVGGGFAAGCA